MQYLRIEIGNAVIQSAFENTDVDTLRIIGRTYPELISLRTLLITS